MKEVIAIMGPEKLRETLEAAHAMGLLDGLHLRVMGRGKQLGIHYMRPVNGSEDELIQFLPKRMLTLLFPHQVLDGC